MNVPRLIAIGNRLRLGGLAGYPSWAARLFAAGLQGLLLREKDLDDAALVELCRTVRGAVPDPAFLSVSARVDVAAIAALDGVHLPSDGIPVAAARRFLGPNRLVGCSTHSLEDVRAARVQGADYVFFGPVRETTSKPGVGALGFKALAEAARVGVPVLALGGLRLDDWEAVRDAGAHGLAGIGAFLPENLETVRRQLARLLGKPALAAEVEAR